jgi:hypothetical protein
MSFAGGSSGGVMSITGLVELLNLVNISVELTKRNAKTNANTKRKAEDIFNTNIPVDTGETLAQAGAEDLLDGFSVFTDVEYGPYNDQGFTHYRNGKIQGYHYSDKTVKDLNIIYAEESSKNLADSIQAILSKTTRSGLGFINPFTGFQGRSTYSFLFGGNF